MSTTPVMNDCWLQQPEAWLMPLRVLCRIQNWNRVLDCDFQWGQSQVLVNGGLIQLEINFIKIVTSIQAVKPFIYLMFKENSIK